MGVCVRACARARARVCGLINFINVYFTYRSEDGDAKIDEAEEVRSGDEEIVEMEEEPEGIINQTISVCTNKI